MVAPTPVSAYLHSATMVKAGVYLVGHAPAFAGVVVWRPLVVTVGLVTMVAGGLRALRQRDLKLLLAFGTVSQLGFMVVLLGIGTAPGLVAGCAIVPGPRPVQGRPVRRCGHHRASGRDRDLRRLRPGGRPGGR